MYIEEIHSEASAQSPRGTSCHTTQGGPTVGSWMGGVCLDSKCAVNGEASPAEL